MPATKPATRTNQPLESLTRDIDRALARALAPIDGAPSHLHEAMRYSVFPGGKRFRPLLCVGAAQAVGGRWRTALPVACAIELIHCYSLVHDDLPAMDNAKERRGKPSCHRQFGEAMAVLVGDALLTRAFELLASVPGSQAARLVRVIGEAGGTAGLIGGQVLDLETLTYANGSRTATRALEEIAKRKTAALMSASVVAGGLVAGADAVAVRALRRYGERLGLAFQLIDDLHDGDGLVRALGPQTVKRKADELIRQATQALVRFGKRARVLQTLADWLART